MEEIKEQLSRIIFEVSGAPFTIGKLLILLVILLFAFLLFKLLTKFLPNYFKKYDVQPKEQKNVRGIFRLIILLLLSTSIIWAMGWNIDIVNFEKLGLTLSLIHVLQAVLILQSARLIDWAIGRVLIHDYYTRREDKSARQPGISRHEGESFANRTAQYIVYIVAAIFIIQKLNLDYELVATDHFVLNISKILLFVLILLVARLGVWVIVNIILYSFFKNKDVEVGSQYAFNQLLKYVIYIIAFVIALDTVGIKMNLILGGLAALLVGVGLGLQQIFNDLFSGIILLFERSVGVGDVLEINNDIGVVKKIGLRTSTVETRDNVSVIVPNSKLVSENVVNWNHFDRRARFQINIGVAYGSDTDKVKEILLKVASNCKYALSYPEPLVRFLDFGESSLDFELHFWSTELMNIEDVKSNMRFDIDKQFRDHEISIPFPQRDLWARS